MLWIFEGLCKALKASAASQDSGRLLRALKSSGGLGRALKGCKRFWRAPEGCGGLCRALQISEKIWRALLSLLRWGRGILKS